MIDLAMNIFSSNPTSTEIRLCSQQPRAYCHISCALHLCLKLIMADYISTQQLIYLFINCSHYSVITSYYSASFCYPGLGKQKKMDGCYSSSISLGCFMHVAFCLCQEKDFLVDIDS